MRFCKSPRDNLKSVGGHRYCVILRKGLEHPWIWVSPGVLEPIPWGGRGTAAFSHTDHPCVGPPPVTCLDFLFRIYCPGGHTASLEGEDGASPRAIQHHRLNFTKTCREDSACNWPLCHWPTLSGQLQYFSGTMLYSVRLGRIVRNHPVPASPAGQNGTQPLQTAGWFSINLHVLLLRLTFLFPNRVLSKASLHCVYL